MLFEEWQIKLMRRVTRCTSVNHVYWFVKNNQTMNQTGFEEIAEKIDLLCKSQNVDWVTIMMAHGTYVFTDRPIEVDPIMFKLTDGSNFEGKITNAQGIINQVNSYLSGKTK